MATSPIYSWPEPDNTDLVKNGALAIRTLGNAIDTTMGTMVAKTVVDAKGDLIAGTAADTVNRLAVGNNGETLVADSAATTGLRYSATPSASNPLINGGFQVWQRGTSFTPTGTVEAYCADRWLMYTNAGTSYTYSRQLTNDTTNLPNIQYCVRIQRTAGNTSAGSSTIQQPMETVNTIPFAGKTVTFSFYARAGANYSATSNVLNVYFYGGTGTDQTPQTYTGSTALLTSTATLTTTWQRFTYSFAVGSTIKEMSPYIYNVPTGTAGANDYYEITGMQVDIGSVALPFRTYAATIQGELAACQRYYWRTSNTGYGHYSLGYAELATQLNISFSFPSTMRTVPSVSSSAAGTLAAYRQGGFIATTSVMTYNQGSTNTLLAYATTAAASLTQFSPYVLFSNNTSSYVEFSAEL